MEGLITLNAFAIQNFEPKTHVYLEDLKKEQFINLLENPTYDFSYDPKDEEHRFNLLFTEDDLSIEQTNANKSGIWSDGKSIYIETYNRDNARISVINLTGQIVCQTDNQGKQLTVINASLVPGIYVEEMKAERISTIQKVIIK